MRRARSEEGFTLIEMIVALALFALISLAGVSLIETVIGTQRRTDDRLERIAQLQRAMYLVTADFEQIDGAITHVGATVSFGRGGAATERRIAYRVDGGVLERAVDGVPHTLVPDVASVDWRFHLPGRGWQAEPKTADDAVAPDAVALEVRLDRRAVMPGTLLRRVVSLPEPPDAPPDLL